MTDVIEAMLSPDVTTTVGINSIIKNRLACRTEQNAYSDLLLEGEIYVKGLFLKVGKVWDKSLCPRRSNNMCDLNYSVHTKSDTGMVHS